MSDSEDHDLLRAWRGEARDVPGELLDKRVLKAAQTQHQRRRALPLAAAMAACVMLALYVQRPQQVAVPGVQLDTSTFGLYEGRGYPQAAQQVVIRQKPGGFGIDEAAAP